MTSPLSPVRNRLHYIRAHLTEMAQGLDFTMPDRMYDRHRNDGAMYYASSAAVLKTVFSSIDRARYSHFLDIGCGKGYVLKAAAENGFGRVGGIEYDDKLAAICEKNIRRIGLDSRVQIMRGDAAAFDRYGDYNCFYFFNPFMSSVMEAVIAAICRQCRGQDVMLIYYHPKHPEPIENAGYFRKIQTFRDRAKDYDIYIYQGVIADA